MRLNFKTVSIVGLLLSALTAKAGQNVGTGGSIVVGKCNPADSSVDTTLLLDYWESQYRRQAPAELADPNATVDEHVMVAINRLKRLDPDRVAKYENWYQDFMGEVLKLDPGINLPNLTDLGTVLPQLPSGCKVQRIVEQIVPETTLDYRYHIRWDLFESLSSFNKAGLILHELVYRDAIERGHATSMNARVFTGLISSTKFDKMTPAEYNATMVTIGLIGYMMHPNTYGNVIRFFDHIELDFLKAKEFCKSLPGDSNLATYTGNGGIRFMDTDREFERSAIGAKIFGPDGTESIALWMFGDTPVQMSVDGSTTLSNSRPTDLHPFICYQEEAKSPWTK